jgi:hypothetical protein
MPTDHEQTPRKLVYLRDHAPRPRARTLRTERKPQPSAHPDLASEAAWLGRLLLTAAGSIAIYWVLILSGAIHPEGEAALNWSASRLLAHIYVAGAAAFAARQLLRGATRASLMVAFAASGLIVISLEGLAHLVINADLSRISLAGRTDILMRTAMLAIGVWAGSYALRADRRIAAS